jgi:DNA processing protein
VLHVAGGLERLLTAVASEPVAIVGSRAASAYGISVATALARGLASAGVPVISGLATGIDSAAHHGAVAGGGITVAVLPGPAGDPYPRSGATLYRHLLGRGAAVSEIPPGVSVRSWMFLARNRLIAALAAMTIVVEAAPGSAALLTARHASELGHAVAAVPGRVTQRQAAGPHGLIRNGAHLVTSAQEVLDLLFEVGTRTALADRRPSLTDEQRGVLQEIEEGRDTPAALLRGALAESGLAVLASLELAGYIRRGPGGRFTVLP